MSMSDSSKATEIILKAIIKDCLSVFISCKHHTISIQSNFGPFTIIITHQRGTIKGTIKQQTCTLHTNTNHAYIRKLGLLGEFIYGFTREEFQKYRSILSQGNNGKWNVECENIHTTQNIKTNCKEKPINTSAIKVCIKCLIHIRQFFITKGLYQKWKILTLIRA